MMQAGIKNTKEQWVKEADTAERAGSGLLPVFATPAMVALMEATAAESVEPLLAQGETTVGTLLEIRHSAATPPGLLVRCESELVEVDRKRLVFDVAAYDPTGEIGRGRHERFIVNSEKFMEKANAKKKNH